MVDPVLFFWGSSAAFFPKRKGHTMQIIEFFCAGCGKPLRADAKFAGKRGKCPQCKTTFTVPASSESSEVAITLPLQSSSDVGLAAVPSSPPIWQAPPLVPPTQQPLSPDTAPLASSSPSIEPSQMSATGLTSSRLFMRKYLIIGGMVAAVCLGGVIFLLMGHSSGLAIIAHGSHLISGSTPYADLEDILDGSRDQMRGELKQYGVMDIDDINAANKQGKLSDADLEIIEKHAERYCNDKLSDVPPPPFDIDQSAADQFKDAKLQPPSVSVSAWGTNIDFSVAITSLLPVESQKFQFPTLYWDANHVFCVEAIDSDGAIIQECSPTLAADLDSDERGALKFTVEADNLEKTAKFRLERKNPAEVQMAK
jgi:hypothetical protein